MSGEHNCGAGTSCTHTFDVIIPFETRCGTTGANACRVQARVGDFWRNYEWPSTTFNIDRTNPLSTHAITSILDHNDGSTLWYADNVAIRVDSRDNIGTTSQSGVDNIFIEARTDTSGCSALGSSNYQTYTVDGITASAQREITSSSDRRVRFCYYAEDNAITGTSTIGNRESPLSSASNVWIDAENPTTSIEPDTTGETPGALSDGWTQNGDFDITVTCSDGGSGCDTIYYDANVNSDTTTCSGYSTWDVDGSPVSRTYTGQLCADGTDCVFTFCAYSVDNVGHQGATDTVTYRIDRRDPVINSITDLPTNDRRTRWHHDDFTLRVAMSDTFDAAGGSGLGVCTVTGPGGTTSDLCSGEQSTTEDFTITVGSGGICNGQGACTLTIRAEDRVGNFVEQTETYYVDFAPAGVPACTVVSTSDAHRCVYTTPGDNTVYYGSNDETCSGTFTASVSSTDPNGANGAGMYSLSWGSNGPVSPQNAVTYSGSTSSTYAYDMTYSTAQGGSPALSPRNVLITPEDNAEGGALGSANVGAACTFPVFYDNEDPTSVLDSTSSSTGWTNGNVDFTIAASDDQVPVRTIWYDYDYTVGVQVSQPACSGDPRTYTAEPSSGVTETINCPDDEICWARLCYAAEDEVANLEDVHTEYFAIDKTSPVVDEFVYDPAPKTGPGPQLSSAVDTWFNESFDVSVTVTDTGSGIDTCWYSINGAVQQTTNGCPAGDGTHGADGDLTRTFTFTVTPADCPEGRDSCSIEAWAFDVVGNEATHRTEVVSIDTSVPTCTIDGLAETGGDIWQYYNAGTTTHYYNNNGAGSFEVTVGAQDALSGIRYFTFPATTSTGTVADHGSTPIGSPDRTIDSHTYGYSFDGSSSYSTDGAPVTTILVQDEAGNVGSCSMEILLDNEPPQPAPGSGVMFDHAVIDDPLIYDPNLVVELVADETLGTGEPGSGVQYAQIRMLNVEGRVTSNLPTCNAFPDITAAGYDPTTDPLIAESPAGFSGPVTPDPTNFSNAFQSGYCHQPYGVFFDNVNNFAPVPSDDAAWRAIGYDDTRGSTAQQACMFFGDYDNCNNRAQYFNDHPVDAFEIVPCDGSCHRGGVSINRPPVTDYQGSPVSILGIDRDGYSDVSESSGQYRLYNITTQTGGRSFTIQASPTSADSLRFGAQSKTVVIDSTDPIDATNGVFPDVDSTPFVLGFRSSECTSSCTLSTDVGLGTCRLDCAGYNGCPEDIPANDEKIQALTACDGLSAGFIANDGSTSYLCCTAIADVDSVGSIGSDFTVNASEIVRNERLVYIGGRLVKLVVVTFDQE